MRAPLAAALLFALVLAGCATPAPTGDHSALAADREAAPSGITLTVNGTGPTYLKVAITNNLDRDLTVTNQAFRLVDASGTVVPIYQVGMGSMSQLVFPTYATLGPRETAKGVMSFFGVDSVAPYVLHYDYDSVSATAAVTQPAPPPSVESVSPSPTTATPEAKNVTPSRSAPVGEWIEGSEARAQATIAHNVSAPDGRQYDNVTLAIEPNGTQRAFRLECSWSSTISFPWHDARTSATLPCSPLTPYGVGNGAFILLSVYEMDADGNEGSLIEQFRWTVTAS